MRRRYKKKKSTDIETLIAKWLRKQNIYYRREYRIDYYPVDFFIPSKRVVIQTDGCYWHFNRCKCNEGKTPTQRQLTQMMKDVACNGVMTSRGYTLIRLQECDIKNDWKKCEEILIKALEGN